MSYSDFYKLSYEMKGAILITGVNGGIGRAIAEYSLSQGYVVFGTDTHNKTDLVLDAYWTIDLALLVDSVDLQNDLKKKIEHSLAKSQLKLTAVINNAAVQILGGVADVTMAEFLLTQKINVAAPLLLTQLCLPSMSPREGSIINIGSIHADLTKSKFVSYATSKAALKGLTQAMAVDLAGYARVNCIEPAAIATPMLVDGFKATPEKFSELEACHPSGEIGTPQQVAKMCVFLIDPEMSFLNGACIGLNGGIASRLHDPV
jgi:NAD(P)-dependent dehydrogenase (short-subunit alcohol dehydrogenase family)